MTVRINKQKINLREKLTEFEDKVNFDEVVRGLGIYPSDGNVGIGTTNPDSLLHILKVDQKTYSTSSIVSDLHISRKNTENTVNESVGIQLSVTGWGGSTTGLAGITAIQQGNASTADLAFQLRDVGTIGEKMRITSDGNVGIGTTNPGAKLEITHLTGSPQLLINNSGTSTGTGSIKFFSGGTGNPVSLIESGGTGSSKQGLFFSTGLETGSVSTRMVINGAGNVGIGTTNPGAKLEISGGGTGVWLKTNNITSRVSNTMAGQNYINLTNQLPTDENSFEIGPGYINLNRDDNVPINQLSFGMNGMLSAAFEVGGTTNSDHSLRFKVGQNDSNKAGIERIRISSNGNVGIGHTNPGGKLHVSDLSVSIGSVTVTNSGPEVTGGTDLDTKISNGDRIKINNEIFTVSNVASTTLTLSGTPSTAGTYTAYTDNNGLIVTSAGNVGIGTTNPIQKLHVRGDSAICATFEDSIIVGDESTANAVGAVTLNSDGYIWSSRNNEPSGHFNRQNSDGKVVIFYKNAVEVGSISTNANSLPSDRNFKRNIADLELGLDFVKKLKPSIYNYKIDDENCPVNYGLIAQDVESALEECGVEKNSSLMLQHSPTEKEEDSDYSLDYGKLIPVLTKAIQEQQAIIEDLKSRIETLESK